MALRRLLPLLGSRGLLKTALRLNHKERGMPVSRVLSNPPLLPNLSPFDPGQNIAPSEKRWRDLKPLGRAKMGDSTMTARWKPGFFKIRIFIEP
ncbi:unnamed protein product [Enterobius vermicularis]|uniref:39S ribosomal protein L41, mitochondrial n=1 Tax=Enterobius vermicularis TaxID=51028 RepID=A0A0N4V803_ENTVE|nr:unnamed protein product [Enterobius vermicularis]